MDRVAVGLDRGAADRAVLIAYIVRFLGRQSSAADGFGEGFVRIGDFQSDVAHTVAMLADMLGRTNRRASSAW